MQKSLNPINCIVTNGVFQGCNFLRGTVLNGANGSKSLGRVLLKGVGWVAFPSGGGAGWVALLAEHHPLPPRKSQVECRRSSRVVPTWPGSLGLGVGRGGVAAKTCAAIGRSEHRVIIAPGLARIANRTDTSPVRLACALPGIDSDAAPRFPASRNPMAAQVLPPVEARHRNRVEKASSIGAVRLSSGGFFAGTHRVPSRARLL